MEGMGPGKERCRSGRKEGSVRMELGAAGRRRGDQEQEAGGGKEWW